MKMYNASLDSFQIQCDSVVYQFRPRQFTNVSDALWPLIYNQYKDRGIFAVPPSMTVEEKKKAHREALLQYLGTTLRERIVNYNSQEDDFRKRGVTFKRHLKHEEALRWDEEIRAMLEMEAPIDERLSFISAEKRSELGITDKRIQEFQGADLFEGFENMQIVEAGDDMPPPEKVGKKGKLKSFKDASFDDME